MDKEGVRSLEWKVMMDWKNNMRKKGEEKTEMKMRGREERKVGKEDDDTEWKKYE